MFLISTHSLTKRLTSDIWHTEFFHRYFNSQPHEEADNPCQHRKNNIFVFQLTASRRGWLSFYTFADIVNGISTHSLTKRLTAGVTGHWDETSNFNSQPHEEADSFPGWPKHDLYYFNSQPHEEADVWFLVLWCNRIISTHSLTKRLTRWFYWKFQMENYFNSQPHEEADDKFGVIPQGCTLFQLTASRRGWLRRVGQPLYRVHFNSQPHEEADYLELYASWSIYHFNSQPHEEADRSEASAR